MNVERDEYDGNPESRRLGRVESLSDLVLMLVLPTIDLGLTEVGNPALAADSATKRQRPAEADPQLEPTELGRLSAETAAGEAFSGADYASRLL